MSEDQNRDNPLRIAVAGASGRMGGLVVAQILDDAECALVGAGEAPEHQSVGLDAATAANRGKCGVPIVGHLARQLSGCRAEVLVDFSVPRASLSLIEEARKCSCRAVIGCTGFDDEQRSAIERCSNDIAIVFAPNTSVGLNILLGLTRLAARTAPGGADVAIVETHHRNKRDAPSGTALKLAEIWDRRKYDLPERVFSQESLGGLDTHRSRPTLHSIRGGDVVGEHTVHFLLAGETLTLRHKVTDRQIFAAGALRAAKWLRGKKAGFYTMTDVLETSAS